MSSDKLKTGNWIFVGYLLYILFIIGVEWISFICWIFCGRNPAFGIAEFLAIAVLAVDIYILRKTIQMEKISYNIGLIIGIVIILILGIMFSAYPDSAFDTFNYHLIAQNPKFTNYFVEDFGYGNFQVWGFRLADRMFYYFRYFFGYRFGTYLNTLCFVVSFVQIFALLGRFEGKADNLIYKILYNKLVWSLIILLSFDAIMMYGLYYVDAIAIPVGLEVLRLLIDGIGKKRIESTKSNIYFALLCGVWLGIKMTNIVYVIPCVAIYLILHLRHFKILDWVGTVFAGLVSFLEYLIFNYKCTGNPLFPYYNTLFKSPYFPEYNFKDGRFGGVNFFEKLFWIWSAAFRPEYRLSEIWDTRNSILIIGLIGSLFTLTYMIIKYFYNKQQLEWQLVIVIGIAAASSSLWGFTTGISRYYIFGRLLWRLIAFWCIFLFAKKWNAAKKYIAAVCLCICVASTWLGIKDVLDGKNWRWCKWSVDTFSEQIKLAFHDNDIKNTHTQPVDLFVLTALGGSGVAELIDDDVYCIYTIYIPYVAIDGEQFIKDNINGASHAYDLHQRQFYDIYEYIETLNANHVYAVDMVPTELSIGTYEMVSLKNLGERKNTVWSSKDGEWIFDVSGISGERSLSFIGGRIYDWPVEEIKFVISLSDGVSDRIISDVQIDNSLITKYDVNLDISEKDTVLKLTPCYVNSGEIVEADQIDYAFGMNLEVQ